MGEKEKCTNCKGSGQDPDFENVSKTSEHKYPCPWCAGSGVLEVVERLLEAVE